MNEQTYIQTGERRPRQRYSAALVELARVLADKGHKPQAIRDRLPQRVPTETIKKWVYWTERLTDEPTPPATPLTKRQRWLAAIERRHCQSCGEKMEPGPTEPPKRYQARKTCGRQSCLTAVRRQAQTARRQTKLGEKRCPTCGKLMLQRHDEQTIHWQRRINCSRTCGAEQARITRSAA